MVNNKKHHDGEHPWNDIAVFDIIINSFFIGIILGVLLFFI